MTLNFRPELDPKVLVDGYSRVTTTLYDPTLENYFKRCLTLFEHLTQVPHLHKPESKHATYLALMGVRERLSAKQIPAYTNFVARVTRDYPRLLPLAIRLAAMGYHFEKITSQQTALQGFREFLETELKRFRESVSHLREEPDELKERKQAVVTQVMTRYKSIPDDFRYPEDGIELALESFRESNPIQR